MNKKRFFKSLWKIIGWIFTLTVIAFLGYMLVYISKENRKNQSISKEIVGKTVVISTDYEGELPANLSFYVRDAQRRDSLIDIRGTLYVKAKDGYTFVGGDPQIRGISLAFMKDDKITIYFIVNFGIVGYPDTDFDFSFSNIVEK